MQDNLFDRKVWPFCKIFTSRIQSIWQDKVSEVVLNRVRNSVVSVLHWSSSKSSYHGFKSQARQGEGPLFNSSNTCADWSVLVSPLCAQHTPILLCTLQTLCPLFHKKRSSGQWHGNTHIMHNSSRIIKMMIVATPQGKTKQKTTKKTAGLQTLTRSCTERKKQTAKDNQTYTMALTPRQYLSHMLRNLGWPPMSHSWWNRINRQWVAMTEKCMCTGMKLLQVTEPANRYRPIPFSQENPTKDWPKNM